MSARRKPPTLHSIELGFLSRSDLTIRMIKTIFRRATSRI
jgi:hypothetical protein